MTYRQLLNALKKLNKEQLDSDAIILDEYENEFFFVYNLFFAEGEDVLDDEHPYLTFNNTPGWGLK